MLLSLGNLMNLLLLFLVDDKVLLLLLCEHDLMLSFELFSSLDNGVQFVDLCNEILMKAELVLFILLLLLDLVTLFLDFGGEGVI